MATNSDQPRQPEPIDRRRLFLSSGGSLLIFVLCLFLPAGTWAWTRGWLFFVVLVVASIVITLYLRRVNPDVIAGRVNRHEGTKTLGSDLGADRLPADDAGDPDCGSPGRRAVSLVPVPWWGCVLGYALLIVGMVGLTWAESVNKFFEPTVRIQTDRGHKVIDTGPYAIVRHPGYVFGFLALPRHAPGSGFLVGFDPCRSCCACSWSCERSGRTKPCGKSWRATRSTPSESDIG